MLKVVVLLTLGTASHVGGWATTASGIASHALGYQTTASGIILMHKGI